MRTFIGIDLGSTTTKAVVMDEQKNVLGRGITNSRSNYDPAAAIAKQEALPNAGFQLSREALARSRAPHGEPLPRRGPRPGRPKGAARGP